MVSCIGAEHPFGFPRLEMMGGAGFPASSVGFAMLPWGSLVWGSPVGVLIPLGAALVALTGPQSATEVDSRAW